MGRLKNIPAILSPDILYALASMGHGDEIVLADANFPATSCCSDGAKLISAVGLKIPALLEAILELFPLDSYVFTPVHIMDLANVDKQKNLKVPIWEEYQTVCDRAEGRQVNFNRLERFEFYERAKTAFAIVATGETSMYANIILQKGIVIEDQA